MTDYPEHDKLAQVKDLSQTCGEFVEWLGTQGLAICEWAPAYEFENGGYLPTHRSRNALLAAFFGIDLDRLEEEKLAMLEEIRSRTTI